VGTSVTAHHVSSARPGDTLECTATPAHVGKRAQLWTVRIESGGRLVALCTLSAMVTARPLHEREAMRVALGEAEARALERARRGADAAPADLRSKL
jgi:predicted thioesterase